MTAATASFETQEVSPLTTDLPTCIARTQDDQVVLDALVSPVSNAKSLELRNFQLDKLNMQQLNTLIANCRHEFQHLSLEKCTLSGDKFFTKVTEGLTLHCVKLAHFRVRRCQQLSMTSLIAMSALFTPALVTLELSSCKLPRQAGIILSQSLQACTSLRYLLLADNNIRDGGLRAIADALKLLHVSSDSAVATALGLGDDSPLSILEHLDISRNGITSAGFASLMQLPLRCLSASGNAIEGGLGAWLLGNSLTLETLCLSGNPLSEDGKLELVRSLFRRRDKTGKSVLRELDLRGCGFDTVGSLELLQRSFHQAATAGQQCSLQTLYLDSSGAPHNDDAADKVYDESCETLKQVAKSNFPGLRLQFHTESFHMETKLSDTEVRPVTLSRDPNTLRSGRMVRSSLGINTEIEAIAMATKTSVNATLASVAGLSNSPLSGSQQVLPADLIESSYLRPITPDVSSTIVQAHPLQQVSMANNSAVAHSSAIRSESLAQVPLQHVDMEYIVSKTIECMSHNFELRLGQFLSRMEAQQQERNSSQVQFLAAKVEACERALPRLEARLDMLTDRIAGGSAQLAKMQTDVALQLQQLRQEALTQQVTNAYSSSGSYTSSAQPSPTMPLSSRMKSQVEEVVSSRVQAVEQRLFSELDRVRATQTQTDPHSVVNAVSAHLTQFKREFDANQAGVLNRFTDSVSSDGRRLEERIAQVEAQISNLESVIQSEQQASLLALEAISDAFNDPTAKCTR